MEWKSLFSYSHAISYTFNYNLILPPMTLHIDGNWNFFLCYCCWCNLPLKKSTCVCVYIWGCLKSNYNLATNNNNKLSAISFSIYAIIDHSCDEFSSMTYRKKIEREREEKGQNSFIFTPFWGSDKSLRVDANFRQWAH